MTCYGYLEKEKHHYRIICRHNKKSIKDGYIAKDRREDGQLNTQNKQTDRQTPNRQISKQNNRKTDKNTDRNTQTI